MLSMPTSTQDNAASMASGPVKEPKPSYQSSMARIKSKARPRTRTIEELMKRAKRIIALLEKDSPFFGSGEDATRNSFLSLIVCMIPSKSELINGLMRRNVLGYDGHFRQEKV